MAANLKAEMLKNCLLSVTRCYNRVHACYRYVKKAMGVFMKVFFEMEIVVLR